jgi:hypothetical protein
VFEEGLENGRVIANTSTECTLSTPQRGCRGGSGKWQGYSKYLDSVHIQYSPKKVQRSGWKMVGLWQILQQKAHCVFPREGAEEGVESGRVIANTSTACTFSTPQRGCRGGGGKW